MNNIKRNKKGQFIKGSGSYKTQNIFKPCVVCKKKFKVTKSTYNKRKFCSRKCMGIHNGKHRTGKGKYGANRNLMKNGYFRIMTPNKKWVYEHRYIMESILGRKLDRIEIVHHVDGNKQNNSPENLTILSKKQHDRYHTKKRWEENTFFKQ